jgi:mono/diheme cytochrome c family protein
LRRRHQPRSPPLAIDHGEQLARRWCSGCHLVAADQRQASADVPPFSVIARMPNFSPEKVAFFLLRAAIA